MEPKRKPKGPWIHRLSIYFFTLILAVLFYWVLGFLVNDIDRIAGPQYETIEAKFVDQALKDELKELGESIARTEREIRNRRDEIEILSAGSRNLQETIGQLIELRKLSMEKSVALPQADQGSLSASLDHFMANQTKFQELNGEVARLSEQKRQYEEQKRQVELRLDEQRIPARQEYDLQYRRHRLYLAGLQLAILLPLLAVGAFLFVRWRGSIYFPMVLGCGAATLVKVVLVMHAHFPARYFKYILILALLAAVAKILVYFIRVAAFPKAQWLLRQYREAYERFLCPICEYPIRTGPRRFLFWKRRTVNRFILPAGESKNETYVCPACGARLYEECAACHEVRHSLLPWCQHCQAEKAVEG